MTAELQHIKVASETWSHRQRARPLIPRDQYGGAKIHTALYQPAGQLELRITFDRAREDRPRICSTIEHSGQAYGRVMMGVVTYEDIFQRRHLPAWWCLICTRHLGSSLQSYNM